MKDLVIGYIQDINHINLLTLPMTGDPSNPNAFVLDPGLLKPILGCIPLLLALLKHKNIAFQASNSRIKIVDDST